MLSLHAKLAPVSACNWSEVSRYREQPAYAPEPTTSVLPNGVDAADTDAGPVGTPDTESAQELLAALAGELNARATATRPSVNTATVAAPATDLPS
jgi:hypothetical protein